MHNLFYTTHLQEEKLNIKGKVKMNTKKISKKKLFIIRKLSSKKKNFSFLEKTKIIFKADT